MQKRAARVITNSNYETRSKTIFKKLKWIPIEFTLLKRDILMTFKAIRCVAPDYINKMFKLCNNGSYQMRSNSHRLKLDKPNTNFMKRSFSYRGACAWNKLPNELTLNYKQLSTSHFKILLTNYCKSLNGD